MKAYEVIEKPENWTRGEYARDASGNSVDPTSGNAICFCAMGAVVAAHGNWGEQTMEDLLRVARQALRVPEDDLIYEDEIAPWNDAPERTHAEVYNLLKSLDI